MKKYAVRKSGPKGRGLYALQTFKRGERIIDYTGPVLTYDKAMRLHKRRKRVVFMSLEDGRIIDGKNCIGRFVNHSCKPNAGLVEAGDYNYLVALKKIGPDEEISFDYQFDTEGSELYPCSCGTSKCRGFLNTREDVRAYKRNNNVK